MSHSLHSACFDGVGVSASGWDRAECECPECHATNGCVLFCVYNTHLYLYLLFTILMYTPLTTQMSANCGKNFSQLKTSVLISDHQHWNRFVNITLFEPKWAHSRANHIGLPDLPSISEWEWEKLEDVWQPKLSNLEDIWVNCRELVKCRCSKGCIHLEHAVLFYFI